MIRPLRLILLLAALPVAALAGTGYKCVDGQGRVSFQDKPCPGDTESHTFRYRASAPVSDTPTAPPTDPVAEDSAPPPPTAEPEPAAEPPEFYLCRRYDGDTYYSDDGVTTPYTVPLGVLGYPTTGLSRAYGSRGRIGLSAPEVSQPGIAAPGGRADAATGDTWVRDECQRLPPQAACQAMRAEHDKLLGQLKHSFREDRPPLDAREKSLARKLAGC